MNLMNLETGQWDSDLLTATAPNLLEKLPTLAPSSTVAGSISPYFCRKFGFSPTCQSILWSGDNPNSLVGMDAASPGQMVISLGTSYTLFAAMDTPMTDPTGFGHVFGNPLGGFMSLICFQEGALACEKLKNDLGLTWEEFDTLASSDELSPVRQLLDQQFTHMLEKSAWMHLQPKTILVTGGGSQSAGIRQTISRIFNATVQEIQTTSSAALGAAKRAGLVESLIEHSSKAN
jgi:xylulokinase